MRQSTYTEAGHFEVDGTKEADDLYIALHNYRAAISGKKNDDGTWTIEATIGDVYDFSEFVMPNDSRITRLKKAFLWGANDLAYLDEKMGLIKPLKVFVDVSTTIE